MSLTVQQLIAQLQRYPKDAKVVFPVPTHDILDSEVLSEVRGTRESWTRLDARNPREYASQEEAMDEYQTMDVEEVIVVCSGHSW